MGEVLCVFGTMGPHIYSWDCCALVVRTSIRLPSGSLSPLEEEGLLFTRYILVDTSGVMPGESTSVLAKETPPSFVAVVFLELQQKAWGSS